MRFTILFASVTLLSLVLRPATAAIIIEDPNDSAIVNRIEGLDINGMLFDVDFTRAGESFDDIYGTGDPPNRLTPYFYYDPIGAIDATVAIISSMRSAAKEMVGTDANPAVFGHVPYLNTITSDTLVNTIRVYDIHASVFNGEELHRNARPDAFGWATFTKQPTAAVPEVSGFGTWLMALACFGIHRRFRCGDVSSRKA